MNKHEYKINDEWAFDILVYGKRFEIRKDDRPTRPAAGDRVDLLMQNGDRIITRVTYSVTWEQLPEMITEGYFIFCFRVMSFPEFFDFENGMTEAIVCL